MGERDTAREELERLLAVPRPPLELGNEGERLRLAARGAQAAVQLQRLVGELARRHGVASVEPESADARGQGRDAEVVAQLAVERERPLVLRSPARVAADGE